MTAESAAATKAKGGRPKGTTGTPKVKGEGFYKAPEPARKSPRATRDWLWSVDDGASIQNICRQAKGRPFPSFGPTGKKVMRETTPEMQLKAQYWIADRQVPAVKPIELTGAEGGAIPVEAKLDPSQMSPAELARRSIILLESMGIREQVERSFGIEPGQNGHAALPQAQEETQGAPIPLEPPPEPNGSDAAERPLEPDPEAFQPPKTVEEIRALGLVPRPNESCWIGSWELRNCGPLRGNGPDVFALWRDGKLDSSGSYDVIERKMVKMIPAPIAELIFAPTVSMGLSQPPGGKPNWLDRLKALVR